MASSKFDHFAYCHDIPPLFHHGLSDMEVVDGICKLSDYSKNVLFNKITK